MCFRVPRLQNFAKAYPIKTSMLSLSCINTINLFLVLTIMPPFNQMHCCAKCFTLDITPRKRKCRLHRATNSHTRSQVRSSITRHAGHAEST